MLVRCFVLTGSHTAALTVFFAIISSPAPASSLSVAQLQFRHVKRQRLVIPHTDRVKKQVAVFLLKPLFKRRKRVFRDYIEVNVTKGHRARAILRRYLTLDLDRPDLQRHYLLEAAAAAT